MSDNLSSGPDSLTTITMFVDIARHGLFYAAVLRATKVYLDDVSAESD